MVRDLHQVRKEAGGAAHDYRGERPWVLDGYTHHFRRLAAALVYQTLDIVHGRLPEPAIGDLPPSSAQEAPWNDWGESR
ncbi:MAG TPA: hypothetical protein VFT74_20315 [Isosphaeraceae bacterium]|nr:hypothetical protein [Isosphaeraceae bacterium]